VAAVATLGAWLDSLPDTVAELRVRAGDSKDHLEHIGIVPAEAARILEDVDGAGFGSVFRVHAYDEKGKQITSRLFTPGSSSSSPRTTGPSEVPATTEGALFMAVQSMERIAERLMGSNERLVEGLAQPLAAMADLFRHESERRTEAEAGLMEAASGLAELEALAARASSHIEALEQGAGSAAGDALRGEVVKLVRGLRATYAPGGDDPDDDDPDPE